MIIHFVVLAALRDLGGGVGRSKIAAKVRFDGFDYSNYKIKAVLEDLRRIGAIHRNGNTYQLTLLGANLVLADIAAANGVEVEAPGLYCTLPAYQRSF